ncbi:L,D-transpeptidase family protein [Aneurinibacillus aneurinilyticus]|nr:L,D-transpeptidase family protein [Aneurinibacillus aneurinilyticus]MED0705440.1 L,D-transpeptidase family protein [Aneurinibacillus aneurinilyticus]MED0724941.1 L,D-transpeptidase family protein [Aneurinibacillus aneurinilyticus]MED0731037.1 L,D-transpeptidase family protein [Aneurinibacillus aneurinilyticus]MED0742724.1 L,D-transpeptidase family protein [Aneurinibacillus aneurinilyticus]
MRRFLRTAPSVNRRIVADCERFQTIVPDLISRHMFVMEVRKEGRAVGGSGRKKTRWPSFCRGAGSGYEAVWCRILQEGRNALHMRNVRSDKEEKEQKEIAKATIFAVSAGVGEETEQIIVVTTPDWNSRQARLQAFEKVGGKWVPALPPMPAVVGKNGYALSVDKKEGDAKSPAGVYFLGTAFGTATKPAGVTMPYRLVTRQDYWIDDKTSPDYNTWVHYEGDPKKKWKSFERLAIPLYKYALVIRYNEDPVIPGKGSAIFVHIWRGPQSYTAGCVALSEANVLAIVKWLDPKKMPAIVQGPESFLASLVK